VFVGICDFDGDAPGALGSPGPRSAPRRLIGHYGGSLGQIIGDDRA
jgi:hypothetical protein